MLVQGSDSWSDRRSSSLIPGLGTMTRRSKWHPPTSLQKGATDKEQTVKRSKNKTRKYVRKNKSATTN